jgi:hypothetical protein
VANERDEWLREGWVAKEKDAWLTRGIAWLTDTAAL